MQATEIFFFLHQCTSSFICLRSLVAVVEAFCSIFLIENLDNAESFNFALMEEDLTGRPEAQQNSVCREHLSVLNR